MTPDEALPTYADAFSKLKDEAYVVLAEQTFYRLNYAKLKISFFGTFC